jgi:hypothetical protein
MNRCESTHPEDHDSRDENARTRAFKQDVGQWLEDRVRYEEYGQTGIVLTVGHIQRLLQTLDFRIADIGTIQECGQV